MKELFIIAVDEITEELHPDIEYYELSYEEQIKIDDMALTRVQDKIADEVDYLRKRKKEEGH